jgi:aminoglycoside phosphotransferase (APT) family kinase protein
MVEDQIVRVLVNDAGLDLADPRIAFLGDGCDHDNYIVNDRFVLRVPKSDAVGQRLETEVALLSMLSDAPISVPRPIGPLRSSAHRQPYCMYAYLPGIEGDLAERIDVKHAEQAFGQMLAYLHRIPVEQAEALGLPVEDNEIEESRMLAERRAAAIPDVVARLRRDALDAVRLRPSQKRVVIHNDLWGEHILIEPQSGRVVGVIDWADACIGDPARDYGGLLAWLGESFLVRVLDSGGIPFDEDDLARARFFASEAGVNSIALGRQMSKPRWIASGEAALKNSGAVA